MQYTHLGRTGLTVSRLCLGTMNFGPRTDEETSHRIMDRAVDEGINFFDTANVYGRPIGVGTTEEIVGRWLAGDKRDQVVLATKVYGTMGDGPNQGKLSAYHIRKACEDSLRRLQTDRIDLYQMHHIDRETPWEEVWQAMEKLVADGKVLYVGSSNFAGWNIADAMHRARERNFLGLVSEQSLYNLAARTIELEVIPACRHFGLGLIPWSPLAGGMLAGALKQADENSRRASDRTKKQVEEHREALEQYESLCDELGHEPAQVALAWLLHQDAVTAPIIGPRTMEQLDDAIGLLDIDLDDPTLKRRDEIWPGPGNQAPEAYAW